MATTTDTNNSNSNTNKSFSLFNYLNEDLKISILSFVADAPMESVHNTRYPASSLTHTLPRVSRKFRNICDTDYFWKRALVRQVQEEPFLWNKALHRLLNIDEPDMKSSKSTCSEEIASMVQLAYEHHQYPCFKDMYKDIVSHHLRFVGPVFSMVGQVSLGQPYSLHLFEPRYRKLIAQVMEGQPESATQGGRVHGHSAMFVHANRGPLAPTTPATLVRVEQCEILADGRANVVLLPVAYVWLEKLWVVPSNGKDDSDSSDYHLYHAQCLKMGQKVTHSMNQLARQEQLAYVMSQLANNLRGGTEDSDDDDPMYSSSGGSSSDGD